MTTITRVFRTRKRYLLFLVLACLAYEVFQGYRYTRSYYTQEHIKWAMVILRDNKPGIGSSSQSITTTDEEELADIVKLLKKRTPIRLWPDLGPVKSYTQEFQELHIELLSDNEVTLDYYLDSFGGIQVVQGFDDDAWHGIPWGGSRK
ncbi:hypothetical protein F4V43_00170 [Paenibacillus spiritus]|uniref:Uncharacterized protein n=1 Tax=Paenibacillus spiritus TaxID=2496557 RepID=A0A5J5GKN7_9BACL|nr:hypothetical protein [Paenibacillus spiritus]KAA9008587.1 hypothetical protein F4V43_00170 [Paenibacillus spiritus]